MAGLLERAAAILGAAGHAASPDAMRRVSATLESVAAWGKTEGTPKAGRLTADLDPRGFEALAAIGGAKSDSAATFRTSLRHVERRAGARSSGRPPAVAPTAAPPARDPRRTATAT